MYQRDEFAVTDEGEIEALLKSLGLGCLVTHDEEGLFATHMPFLYEPGSRALVGHVARANPHWKRAGSGEALVIFQGADAYISPSWYPSKAEHGRVVPTWNYEAVHVCGRLAWRDDRDWLIPHLAALTDHFEAGRAEPWALSDAPGDYVERLASGVVGLEVSIERVEAKRKLSQNRDEAERQGVIAGLSASGTAAEREMAERMSAQARARSD